MAALAEVGRVLRPGGTFLLFLNHPLLQAPGSGWVDGGGPMNLMFEARQTSAKLAFSLSRP